MSELEQFVGRIVDVMRRTDGDTLAVAAGVGATTLTVHDTADFDETGGQLLFSGELYTYDTVDHDAATIHLTTPVTVAGSVDDPVDVFDEAAGTIVVEYVAHILLDENDPDDEPLEVTVNHALVPMLKESVRGEAAETVTLIRDGDDDLVIWQVDGKLAVDVMATEAVLAADQAMDMALQGLTAAQLAQAMLDGEVNIYYADEAPWANDDATHDDDTGDIWVDTNAPTDTAYRWLSRTWTLIGEASLVSALLAAQSAQTTLDGKIRRLYKNYEPVQDGDDGHFGYGDSLIRTDQDNKEYFWDGDSWEPLLVGDDAIAATLTGKIIQTAFSGNRILMRQDSSAGVIEGFTGDSAGETYPSLINPTIYGTGGSRRLALDLQTGRFDPGGTYIGYLRLFSGTYDGTSGPQATFSVDQVNMPAVVADSFSGPTYGTHNGSVNGGSVSGTSGSFSGQVHGNTLWSDVDAGGTASGADIGADGKIKRTTSSERYKTSITPAVVDTEVVLSLTPKRFQRIEEGPEGRHYLGLIAEDVEAAGLDDLVFHNGEGLVEGVHYGDALVTALLAVCKTQQAQIDALTARVTALEA